MTLISKFPPTEDKQWLKSLMINWSGYILDHGNI